MVAGYPMELRMLSLRVQACVCLHVCVQVAGLRGITSEPATLDSASHVFAYGQDLFYSRVAPSGSYDMLPEDFPYALLLLILGVMAVACVVLRSLLQKKALNTKWA
jgi:hypothetical protein